MNISVSQPSDELSAWLQVKEFVDMNNILETVEFENFLIASGDIDLQRNISRTPYYYTRAINYINSRRSSFIKNKFFEEREGENDG